MRDRGTGIVHNVSSGVAATGHPGLAGYASTKGAIEGFVRSLRLELDEAVAVTLVYPPLTNTRSAARLYPASMTSDPADVGRKLAAKIESTGPVIYADWYTRFGMALARRVPWLVERGTRRFLEDDAVVPER
jgi:short-subunit dehydrogenase